MSIEVRSNKGKILRKNYPIVLVDLIDLIPHEQTIPHELTKFIDGIQKSRTIYWPLMIDKYSNLILDGHHRTAGLKHLRYKNIPAVLLDYQDDELVKLDTWYPLINIPVEKIIDELSDLKFKIDMISELNMNDLKERKFTAIVGNKDRFYRIEGEREDIFELIRSRWLDEIIYYDDAQMCLDNSDNNHTSVIAWSYTKNEVLDIVLAGKIFLPKTTRHTLKFETFKCNFSIDNLDKL